MQNATLPLPLQSPLLAASGENRVRHGFFTRQGGVSGGIYASLNGGVGSSDDPDHVRENRARMAAAIGVAPDRFLTAYQIHSPDVVTIDAPANCPEAINIATNPYHRGKFGGEWIIKELGGKGNIVIMNGQAGTSNTIAQQQGLEDAIAEHPGVKLTGSLYGMWTGSVAKTEMLKFLATHPQPVDAIFSTGNMGVGVSQALEQSGRPLAVVTEVTNLCSFLAYWKEKNLVANTFVQDGGPMGYAAFIPALHAMAGQKPKVNTIFMPLPTITAENIDDYWDPSMTVESTCFANGKDLHLVPNSYFEQFFTGGEPRPGPAGLWEASGHIFRAGIELGVAGDARFRPSR